MKCQILFSGKHKKNILNLLSAELAPNVIKVKYLSVFFFFFFFFFFFNFGPIFMKFSPKCNV